MKISKITKYFIIGATLSTLLFIFIPHQEASSQTTLKAVGEEAFRNEPQEEKISMLLLYDSQAEKERALEEIQPTSPLPFRAQSFSIQEKTKTTLPFIQVQLTKSEYEQIIKTTSPKAAQKARLYKLHLTDSIPAIEADLLHSKTVTGNGYHVAVLDTGVDNDHSFLSVTYEACFSNGNSDGSSVCPGGLTQLTNQTDAGEPCTTNGNCGHGTHVAGIATGNNGTGGIDGVAKDAGVISIQVFTEYSGSEICGGSSPCIGATDTDLISALAHINDLHTFNATYTDKIAAVNLSLGGSVLYQSENTCDSDNSLLKVAIDNLAANGIPVVVSSGNESYRGGISSPACISSAIAVGATDNGPNYQSLASFSNTSSLVDLLAPGTGITSSQDGGGYGSSSGTSMAAPHVAGAFALLRQAMPLRTYTEQLNSLKTTGYEISTSWLSHTEEDEAGTEHSIPNGSIDLPAIKLDAATSDLNVAPDTPSITLSSGTDKIDSQNPNLIGSTYNDADGSPHTNTQWDVATDNTFTDIVWSRTSDTSETSTAVNTSNGTFSGSLAGETNLPINTYYIRLRYQDILESWSNYSPTFSFTIDIDNPIPQAFSTTTIAGTYGSGTNIDITLSYDKNLISGSTEILLSNGKSVTLDQLTDNTLTGTYTVEDATNSSTEDTTNLQISQITSQNVTDEAGNNETNTAFSGTNIITGINIDATYPSLNSISISPISGIFGPEDTLDITATYNEDIQSGTLIIDLNNGESVTLGQTLDSTLSGTYTVGSTGSGQDIVNLKIDSINSHNVEDPYGNENTDTTLPNNIADGIQIDTTAPALTSLTTSSTNATGRYVVSGDVLTITAIWDEGLQTTPTFNINGVNQSVSDTSNTEKSANYTTLITDSGNLTFTISNIQDAAGNFATNLTEADIKSIFQNSISGISDNSINDFNPVNQTDINNLYNDDGVNLVAKLSDLKTEDNNFEGPNLLNALNNEDIVVTIKKPTTLTSTTTSSTLVITKSSRTTETDKDYLVVIPAGTTLNTATNFDPIESPTNPTISNHSVKDTIKIPTGSNVTFDNPIEVCLPGSASLWGVNTANNITIYFSNDDTNWSIDNNASNLIFNDKEQFCFQTNHLTSFAATTTNVPSSSGGGGGGSRSKTIEPESITHNQNQIYLTFTDELDPDYAPEIEDFSVTQNNDEVNIKSVALGSFQITVTLNSTVTETDELEIEYDRGNTIPRNQDGDKLSSFDGTSVWTETSIPATTIYTPTSIPTETANPNITAIINILELMALQEESNSSCSTTTKTLRPGSTGADVSSLQTNLRNRGLYQYSIDGRYENGTKTAVQLFQKQNNLVADGIAGKNTLAALYSGNCQNDSAKKLREIITVLKTMNI